MTAQLSLGFETAPIANASHDAVPAFWKILERFNAAVLASDQLAILKIDEEARTFAAVLNGGTHFGMMADQDSPCCVLERETAARPGKVPIWGQIGNFEVEVEGVPVRIEKDGIYGIGGIGSFAAHRVDMEQPFPISETGYRSFLTSLDPPPPMTVDAFVLAVLQAHLREKEAEKPKRKRKVSESQAVSA